MYGTLRHLRSFPTRRSSDLPVLPRLLKESSNPARRERTKDEAPPTVLSPQSSVLSPPLARPPGDADRKSTRLNSSHVSSSYAVFHSKNKNRRRRGLLIT